MWRGQKAGRHYLPRAKSLFCFPLFLQSFPAGEQQRPEGNKPEKTRLSAEDSSVTSVAPKLSRKEAVVAN